MHTPADVPVHVVQFLIRLVCIVFSITQKCLSFIVVFYSWLITHLSVVIGDRKVVPIFFEVVSEGSTKNICVANGEILHEDFLDIATAFQHLRQASG